MCLILVFCITLWIFPIILIITNPRNNAIRLSGLVSFLVGFGGLADEILYRLIPFMQQYISRDLLDRTKLTAGFLNTLAYYYAPYFLLIFSISYSEIIKFKKKYLVYLIYIVLFLPIIYMNSLFIYPVFRPSFLFLCFSAIPYFLLSNLFLIYGVIKAKNRHIKEQKLLSYILIAPLASVLFIINYIGPIYGVVGNFLAYLNDTAGILALFGFILLAAKYGVLGVKIDVSNINNQMRIATLGTNMLNHSLKNEIAKVKICINNITSFIEPNPITAESMQIIDSAFNRIINMMSRIQEKTKPVVLNEEPCNLRNIVNSTINNIKPLIQNRNLEIINKVEPGIVILSDKFHLEEVISNIFKNAIEAIPDSKLGRIDIEAKCNNKQIVIKISDNGSGIEKELLPCVFDPFFSTKHPDHNFGLGLSYSLNVIQKSGGTIEIQSELNQGTTLLLKFPISKLVS